MNFFDDEVKIIEKFQNVKTQEVFFPLQTENVISVFNTIYDKNNWGHWKNNSGKSDPPPDFFSEKYNVMMEVMRVDDHAHYNEKGVLINPVNQRESMIQKEIRQNFLSRDPKFDFSKLNIIVNALSGLPTNEDHNYHFYYDNFKRVLKKHMDSIPLYKENHPNKKLIFFIFDESTGYLVTDEQTAKKKLEAGEYFNADPVLHFLDKKFIDVFRNIDIDYLIWYAPYKMFYGAPIQLPDKTFYGVPIQFPKVCVFDVKKCCYENLVEYPDNLIVSSEA